MPLSPEAAKSIPEIVTWLNIEAAAAEDPAAAALAVGFTAGLMLAESAKPTLDDTADLFHTAFRLGHAWCTSTMMWFYAAGEAPYTPHASWHVELTETETGARFEITHQSLMATAQQILDNRVDVTTPAGEGLDLNDVKLIEAMLGATTRTELEEALAEIYPRLCMVLVQLAAFREYRYRDAL